MKYDDIVRTTWGGGVKWLLKAIKVKIIGKTGKGGVKMVLTRLENIYLVTNV